MSNLCTKNSEPVLLEAKRTNQANLIELFRVCGKKFVGGVRSQDSVAGRRSFQALLPSFFVLACVLKKDNAKFLKVTILFSQHEHRILTGQKPYFKRVLPLFSKPYLFF